tara:strand:+ start:113 stop:379 length:267 start_codon:yes stop_codon:yes gene_type:complete
MKKFKFTDISLLDVVTLQNNKEMKVTGIELASKFCLETLNSIQYLYIKLNGMYLIEYDLNLNCIDKDVEVDGVIMSDFNILQLKKGNK